MQVAEMSGVAESVDNNTHIKPRETNRAMLILQAKCAVFTESLNSGHWKLYKTPNTFE